MNPKLKSCPQCFWKANCGLCDKTQKNCSSFTTRKELIKKGYLPDAKSK